MVNAVTPISPAACKKIIAAALAEDRKTARLSARTISFEDLARASMVFVTIHDWASVGGPDAEGSALWARLAALARVNGFRVQDR
jgi:hypothetical protein